MALEDVLEQIRHNLRHGRFQNEAAVSQGVVLPILQSLDWPVFDTAVVVPQYQVERLFVDYVLCHSSRRPAVSVEVKSVGKVETGESQLFEYVFRLGVALAVLTDGQEWRFYLTYGPGDYEDRLVYKLDILQREVSEGCVRLRRYLDRDAVLTMKAVESARADYEASSSPSHLK